MTRCLALGAASLLLSCSAPGQTPSAGRLVIDEALAESTQGTRSGGRFVGDGWEITALDDSILWHIPTVRQGAAEFSVRGLCSREGRAGMAGKNELFHMYDWMSGEADRVYVPAGGGVGGYRNNPFKHFIRKTNVLDTRPGKTDSLELLLKIHDKSEEPDSRALEWDPAAIYRFRVEWGPDGAGNCVMKVLRDDVLLRTLRQPGEWAPAGHGVRIGASVRGAKDEQAAIGAVFSRVQVWDHSPSTQ